MMQKILLSCLLVALVYCSSHSEAPGTAKMPQSDITDVYAFRCYEPGREDHTCLIFNANALQAPGGGPNYFTLSDDHFYEIYIDNDGDAKEDITFSFYAGSSLGGELQDVLYHADEDDCVLNQNPRSTQPDPIYVKKHGGITVSVDGRDVPVALKTVGTITANDQSALNWHEWYRIRYITGDRTYGDIRSVVRSDNKNDTFTKPFDYSGTKTFPDYETYANQYIYNIDIPDCPRTGRVFVGQRAESFSIPIGEVFDLINFIPIPDFPGAITQDKAHNTIAGFNLDSFALEIPTECLVRGDQRGVIGVWTAVRRLHHDKDAHVPGKQTSRLGNPLVNELFIGLRDKGKFSNLEPQFDQGFVDEYLNYPSFPEIISILFKDAVGSAESLAPKNFPRDDLNAIFMTGLENINQPPNVVPAEMMRLNTSTPVTARSSQNSMGVIGGDGAGYPNGRRPGDDTIDISLQAAMGKLCSLGLYCTPEQAPVGAVNLTDGAPTSANDFLNEFPYLNTPNPGSVGL